MVGIKETLVMVALIFAAKAEDKAIGVTVQELLDLIRFEKVTIIDVREPWELRTEGKIAGSINIPGWKLQNALTLPPKLFQTYYKIEKPSKSDCNLIFHCKSGGRSLKAVQLARAMGWTCSRHLLGGFTAWKNYFD